MSEDAQDPVELHVHYAAVKKWVAFFVNPTDKLDDLKAKLDGYLSILMQIKEHVM